MQMSLNQLLGCEEVPASKEESKVSSGCLKCLRTEAVATAATGGGALAQTAVSR